MKLPGVQNIVPKSRFGLWVGMLVVPLILGCATTGGGKYGDETADSLPISSLVEQIWSRADQRKGLRVYQYPELLPVGTEVRPVIDSGDPDSSAIVCENPSRLFFVDEEPGAHFVHATRIVVLDDATGAISQIATNRWPQIDGLPVFDTYEARNDSTTLVLDRAPAGELRSDYLEGPIGWVDFPYRHHDPCNAYAIIVCGWGDGSDSFDEDAEDLFHTLTALGLHENKIFVVSPHIYAPGVDKVTTVANVQWAIDEVAAVANETDKVLFFFASHGNIDRLFVLDFNHWITADDLDSWLDRISCGELSVVIEAPHSGSLIGRYADDSYVADENDLTGEGEINRCILTSASTNTSSYADIDWTGDPNPGDYGSETVHGWLEAFAMVEADSDADGEISFGEACRYALDKDMSRITGVNTPQFDQSGLAADEVYSYCYRIFGEGDLFISDGPADMGHNSLDFNSVDIWVAQDKDDLEHKAVVGGMPNLVNVAVHNRGTTVIADGTLGVYWAYSSAAPVWPEDFTQIGETDRFYDLLPGNSHFHTWTWEVDQSMALGRDFCLIAVAESPSDSLDSGLSGIGCPAPYDNNIGQKNISIVSGHNGMGEFRFNLGNNTDRHDRVDLYVTWVGEKWGDAVLTLADNLTDLVATEEIKVSGFEPAEVPGQDRKGLRLTSPDGGRLLGIPLKPGQSSPASWLLKADTPEPGTRSLIRLEQAVNDTVIGAVTLVIRHVAPDDCDWVWRASIESLSALALRYDIDSLEQSLQIFTGSLPGGICRKQHFVLRLLTMAHENEVQLAADLPAEADTKAKSALLEALADLGQAIEAEDTEAALAAQGRVAEAVNGL